jgi:TPR repeat protein
MKVKTLSLAALLILGAHAANASSVTPTPCDQLAAHPWDPERVAGPVYWNQISSEKAVLECRKAVEAEPTPRNMYQYARALSKARRYEEAAGWLMRAAEAGYPQAEFSLGDTYEYGEGVPRSRRKAKDWYTRAASHGHEKARDRVNKW